MATTERRRTSARRESLLGDQPGAFASARYVRITPMKARRVVDLVRGLPVDEALAILQFAPQAAAATVRKVLESAIAFALFADGDFGFNIFDPGHGFIIANATRPADAGVAAGDEGCRHAASLRAATGAEQSSVRP
jgi:hypothetical protein